jgi:hypothetical protein
MAELLPAGDKIAEYDARVDPDAPPEKQKVSTFAQPVYIYICVCVCVCVFRQYSPSSTLSILNSLEFADEEKVHRLSAKINQENLACRFAGIFLFFLQSHVVLVALSN